jgi:hypothetical protein
MSADEQRIAHSRILVERCSFSHGLRPSFALSFLRYVIMDAASAKSRFRLLLDNAGSLPKVRQRTVRVHFLSCTFGQNPFPILPFFRCNARDSSISKKAFV